MAYREQASKIRITAMPVSGLSGTLVTLMATVDSRYPIEKVEWSGDAELLAGLQLQGSLGSGLILPQLPLTVTDGQEYSLYLTVTDSRGTRVTSERIPVRVTQDETSFRSWINVINDDVQVEDGNFVISTPLPAGEEGRLLSGTTCASALKRSGRRSNHVILSINQICRVWHLKRSVAQSVTAIGLNGFW